MSIDKVKYNILLNNIISYAEKQAMKYNDILLLQNDKSILEYRCQAIIWLKGVTKTFRLSSETRDTAIQILDNYFCKSLNDDACTKTKHEVSQAVVSSILLAAKMQETNNFLSMKNFTDFDSNELISYQYSFLQKINFEIYPNATPTSCINVLLGLWDCDDENLKKKLASNADTFIVEFYCSRKSLLYAPSTIAICALIISFSVLRMDCTNWLSCVPDLCLRKGSDDALLDIDSCLDMFQKIERLHRINTFPVGSPTSIACSSEDMDQVNESPANFCFDLESNNDLHKVPALKVPDTDSLGPIDLQSIEEDCTP